MISSYIYILGKEKQKFFPIGGKLCLTICETNEKEEPTVWHDTR